MRNLYPGTGGSKYSGPAQIEAIGDSPISPTPSPRLPMQPLLREGTGGSSALPPVRTLDDLAGGVDAQPGGDAPERKTIWGSQPDGGQRSESRQPFGVGPSFSQQGVRRKVGRQVRKYASWFRGSGMAHHGGGGSKSEDSVGERVVYVGQAERTCEGQFFAGNKVRTSKYTLITFLPRNLFEQFHRIAYIYFLAIAVLNQIPVLAVFGRTASIFPLIIVLLVTALKDGYEDWGRRKADKVENNKHCSVLGPNGAYHSSKWMDIRVGDVLKLQSGATIPCDLVLLDSSEEGGKAYIETMNLDGESTLKARQAVAQGQVIGTLTCEEPNESIYEFTGVMAVEGRCLPLGPSNMLLRGSDLRNTAWVVGVVVYAGKETKAQLNNSGAQSKRSRLEVHLNRETLILGAMLVGLCVVGAVGLEAWLGERNILDLPYYGGSVDYHGAGGEAALNWFSCLIRYQILVPISLYISMELVRLGQSYLMVKDAQMYDEKSDTPLQVRALNINEDLGQIKYVLSDKTGTLTENRMEFHACSIAGTDYSQQSTVPQGGEAGEGGTGGGAVGTAQPSPHLLWHPKAGARVDPSLVRALQARMQRQLSIQSGNVHLDDSSAPGESERIHLFMLTLAACNTVIPTQHGPAGPPGGGGGEYQGESPDEQALVTAAAAYGYTLLKRSQEELLISVLNHPERYAVLGTHEFDSVRKRMSVVVRLPDGRVKVLVKGADSVMMDLIRPNSPPPHHHSEGEGEGGGGGSDAARWQQVEDVKEGSLRDLDLYAREGLRTLVLAERELGGAELQRWQREYEAASTAMHDRAAKVQAAATGVERGLDLLGGTGIEDRLAEGVAQTISVLRSAGIHVWLLTGDKVETAVAIAFSSQLLTRSMQQVVIGGGTREEVVSALSNACLAHGAPKEKSRRRRRWRQAWEYVRGKGGGLCGFEGLPKESAPCPPPLALIIDGGALLHALEPEVEEELFELTRACQVVLCCRVAPIQKAAVVSLVKRKSKDLCLAIGDGANDVSMIQMADIGVGISGQEGRQAVMASDFAIAQFRFLTRLLLVHGHWNYTRLSYMVLYNFYRNAVFIFLLFWYLFYAAWTPQSGIGDWSLVFFSLCYTSVPTIAIGILEQNLASSTLLRLPALYAVGQRSEMYNTGQFWGMMADMMWQSLVIFYVPLWSGGWEGNMYGVGQVWIFGVVVVVCLHLAMDVRHWTWIHHVTIWCSILLTYIVLLVLDLDASSPDFGSLRNTASKAFYWLDLVLIVVVALGPRFVAKYVYQRFFPSDIQVAYEAQQRGRLASMGERPMELSEVETILSSPSAPPAF